MKMVRTLALVATLGGALAGGSALAQPPDGVVRGEGPRRGHGGPGMMGRGGPGLELRQLNLTDAQGQQIRTLTQQHREQTKAAATRLHTAMEAQRKAVETVPLDEAAIRATTQELVEAQTELAIERARLHAEVFALLTPEQQAQAAKLRAEREARRSQMRERMQQRQPRQQD